MIKLQPLAQDNIEYLRNLRNENRTHFFNSDLISAEQQVRWFSQFRPRINQEEMFIIMAERPDKTSFPIGAIHYKFHSEGEVELGRIMIEDSHRGGGYLQEAISNLLDNLKFERCYLTVRKDNTRAVKAYKKCNFVIESEFVDNGVEGYVMVYNKSKES